MLTVFANENLKTFWNKNIGELSIISYFTCAGLAGVFSSIFTTPLDNIKTRLNLQRY